MTSSVSNLLTSDKETLCLRSWNPKTKPIATVTFIHGLGEHSGRYEHVFSKFADEGIKVNAFDQRGHGVSTGVRGHSPSLEQSLKDIQLIASTAESDLPHFIYGHSFGGCLALHYNLKKKDQSPSGCIVTSPLIRTTFKVPGFKLAMGNFFGKIMPTVSTSNNIDPSFISRDPEAVKEYKEDKLVHAKITLGMGKWLLQRSEQLIELAPEFDTP
ncbi:hypothetical protein DICPUDRAFT_92131, partial [Dictyostelium purpureum]